MKLQHCPKLLVFFAAMLNTSGLNVVAFLSLVCLSPVAVMFRRFCMLLIAAYAVCPNLLHGVSPVSQSTTPDDLANIRKTINRLKSLHAKQEKPKAGEWRAQHKEKGQTFFQYLRSRPVRFTEKRNTIYVTPIGEFTERQNELVKISCEFLSLYFSCPVKTLDPIELDEIPAKAKRIHPTWGDRQLLTSYILDEVLTPKLPKDAASSIALSSVDLWPGDGWNFAFGYASFENRVGVWSFYRNGKADGTDIEFQACLKRTLKVATHETGHMVSMPHCTAYRCNMQGSNSLPESDRQPLYCCPECHAKILFATGCDPQSRFKALASFFRKHKFKDEADFYEKSLARLQSKR